MQSMTRLPAFPLITSDPYLSVWSMRDRPSDDDTRHWAGQRKRLTCVLTVDNKAFGLLGRTGEKAADVTGIRVTPTLTEYAYEAMGVKVALRFRAPLLLDDMDLMSMPVTFVDCAVSVMDGKAHEVCFALTWHDDICYDGEEPKPMIGDTIRDDGFCYAYMGRKRQEMLCHSGDHITIDWGYAYLAALDAARFDREAGHYALKAEMKKTVFLETETFSLLLGYDDVASINYFGTVSKAWYARGGATIVDALKHCRQNRSAIHTRLDALDEALLASARQAGGEAYAELVSAAYRQSIAAHKLIAGPDGEAVFLSKENDSNGCMGTADVSYPSIPLYLLYNPELVRAMCRPILKFANYPVWGADFAPHDVGRYPHATGQVYGIRDDAYGPGLLDHTQNGDVYPPLYLGRGERDIYHYRYQMPVEECGNMILMLAAALRADGHLELIKAYLPTLEKWVRYLAEFGRDPGEQLCTDDFAGHLNHNVNLAFKAVCGVAAYAWMLERLGDKGAEAYAEKAREMAKSILARADRGDHTALTLDGDGWSLKYNAVWDMLFQFGLFDNAFFEKEIAYYLKMQNVYGVPLDSRADYTKSDWILWAAAMGNRETVEALSTPVAQYLRNTASRVPFSDWYDTKTGRFMSFIARSVQGGIFMPLLKRKWAKERDA